MTMTLIETITVGVGGSSTISFTSIPQTYTDLRLVISARSSATAGTWTDVILRLNASSANNYTGRFLYGEGSSPGSGVDGPSTDGFVYRINSSSATSNTFGNGSLYIPNYTGSTNKTVSMDAVTENNATSALQIITAGLWAQTAAITQITFTTISGTFVQYSSASLYGILKGSGGATVS